MANSQDIVTADECEKKIQYTRAVMGADAIARFDVTPTSRMNGTLNVQGVEISGCYKKIG